MARIDWAVACDLAFFDRQDRLCIVGITNRLPVPRLPLAINQLMLVARLVDLRPVEEIEISVAVLGPSGLWTTPTNGHDMGIEMGGEYVLVTLREIPLIEEGVYGFQINLSGQEPASIEIPVLTVGSAIHADVH
jgi:hypothetical protein